MEIPEIVRLFRSGRRSSHYPEILYCYDLLLHLLFTILDITVSRGTSTSLSTHCLLRQTTKGLGDRRKVQAPRRYPTSISTIIGKNWCQQISDLATHFSFFRCSTLQPSNRVLSLLYPTISPLRLLLQDTTPIV